MAAPGTFERVYQAIKFWLSHGEFRAGERLEPGHLSERLNASVTPVREALHRLTGERLVDAPPHEGFRVPVASEVRLRHLYAWHRDLLMLAVARRAAAPIAIALLASNADEPVTNHKALFLLLATATGNLELVEAIRGVLDRLEPFQRLEAELLSGFEEETRSLAAAIALGDRSALRRILSAYYRRRQRVVPQLVARAARSFD